MAKILGYIHLTKYLTTDGTVLPLVAVTKATRKALLWRQAHRCLTRVLMERNITLEPIHPHL